MGEIRAPPPPSRPGRQRPLHTVRNFGESQARPRVAARPNLRQRATRHFLPVTNRSWPSASAPTDAIESLPRQVCARSPNQGARGAFTRPGSGPSRENRSRPRRTINLRAFRFPLLPRARTGTGISPGCRKTSIWAWTLTSAVSDPLARICPLARGTRGLRTIVRKNVDAFPAAAVLGRGGGRDGEATCAGEAAAVAAADVGREAKEEAQAGDAGKARIAEGAAPATAGARCTVSGARQVARVAARMAPAVAAVLLSNQRRPRWRGRWRMS